MNNLLPPSLNPHVTTCVQLPDIGAVFASIEGQYKVIRSLDETGAHTYDPALPLFSDLDYVAPDYGFWVKMIAPTELKYPANL